MYYPFPTILIQQTVNQLLPQYGLGDDLWDIAGFNSEVADIIWEDDHYWAILTETQAARCPSTYLLRETLSLYFGNEGLKYLIAAVGKPTGT